MEREEKESVGVKKREIFSGFHGDDIKLEPLKSTPTHPCFL
jgi:hypothetical protein